MVKKAEDTEIVLKFNKKENKYEEYELNQYQILLLDVLERIVGGLHR
jgi:hypothetical protein